MANEIDEIKNVGKDTPDASDVKDSADSKKSKDKDKSKKAASAKKPKKGIVKYFKDCKAEFKKVAWLTQRQNGIYFTHIPAMKTRSLTTS